MKQIALDIGLASPPSFTNFFAGPNEATLRHLELWAGNSLRSPVPTYLWGPSGSGKTHLLKAVREALREQGAAVGWMDAGMPEPEPYRDSWAAVLLDEVHLYSPVQQHAAFTWFVNAQTHQRWVLAAVDKPPALLQLRDDLRTRLGWGHVFGLTVLSEPERRSVLRQAGDPPLAELASAPLDSLVDAAELALIRRMAAWPRTVEAAAIASPRAQEWTAGKAIRKVIVVPGKLVNIVV
jgi:DnaA family protein